MTLEEKVRALVMGDEGPYEHCLERLPWDTTDYALVNWGLVYGIAFGLARTEEPCEPVTSVAARAKEAAWPVFVEFNGGPLHREPLTGVDS
jgi:hypothetical protein